MTRTLKVGIAVAAILAAGVAAGGAPGLGQAMAEEPQRGGTLRFVVPDEPPSFDGHRETTFALIHPIAPFYSLLTRINPENPSSTSDIVCDLCTEIPKPENDGKRYTFKIRQGVTFHDGTPLTAKDVAASFRKIVNPPEGVQSARKAYFEMVDKVEAPDDETVVFELKYPSGAFMKAVANPFNFIYSKAKLDQDMHWYEKNILGSGPFKFGEWQPGATMTGVKNENYHHKGQPYLDGYEAIFAPQQSVRAQAIRGDRAAIEFRGFPPKSRDELKEALGDKITVQESDWNCVLLMTPNHRRKPMDDVRVRRAMTLALDRWNGSKYLSEIAVVKTVGGVVFPGDELAATKEELQQIAGYWPDHKKSQEEAKRLLQEAGVSTPLNIKIVNRAVDQPYKIVGIWVIDQLRQIGVHAEQEVLPTGPFYDQLRIKHEWDIAIEFNCQSNVNPLLDVSKFVSEDISGSNYGGYIDRELDKMFEEMNRTGDVEKQRSIMRAYEKRVLDEEARMFITLWWYRIVPHRSYVKGWKISPSHYLNQQLDNVWLDKSLM